MPDGMNKEDLAANYGYALSFLKSDKELWGLFNTSVKENYTQAQFMAKLRATDWYQHHSATYRQAVEKRSVDPASWEEAIRQQRASIMDIAGSMGAHVNPAVAAKLANDVLLYGWSEGELKNRMSGYVDVVKGTQHFGGAAGDTEDDLRTTAEKMGQRMSNDTLKSWVRSISRGDSTLQDFDAHMRARAEAQYPGYTDQIRRGLTVKDVADPYIETVAKTLELNPANIDIFDPHVQRALTQNRADNGKPNEFSMADFELSLRQDPRWAKTSNARDQMSSVANKVLQDWGFR